MIKRLAFGLLLVVCFTLSSFAQDCATQTYFASPGSEAVVDDVVIQSIEGARTSLEIAVASLTSDRVGTAVIRAHRRGVAVRVILAGGREGEVGSEYDKLLSAGVPVRLSHASETFEHQFAIVDRRIVLSGSYEWANPANVGALSSLVRITCMAGAEASSVEAYVEEYDRLWAKSVEGEPVSAPQASTSLYFSVIIFSVDPVSQYIYLLNLSDQPIDLCDWSISDLEGQYTFPCEDEDSIIHPGDSYRICIDELDPACVSGDFQLALEHDEVFLVTPEGDIVDEVVW